jgi:hypothetical protein
MLLRPYYPVSGLFRIERDEDSLHVDFMSRIDGVRSLAALRSRAAASILAAMRWWWRIWRTSSEARGRRTGRGIARCWRF